MWIVLSYIIHMKMTKDDFNDSIWISNHQTRLVE